MDSNYHKKRIFGLGLIATQFGGHGGSAPKIKHPRCDGARHLLKKLQIPSKRGGQKEDGKK